MGHRWALRGLPVRPCRSRCFLPCIGGRCESCPSVSFSLLPPLHRWTLRELPPPCRSRSFLPCIDGVAGVARPSVSFSLLPPLHRWALRELPVRPSCRSRCFPPCIGGRCESCPSVRP